MTTAVAIVPRSPVTCWRVFTDPTMFPAWLPGLRKAQVLSTDDRGRPLEIAFEFATSRTYSLVYSYDDGQREVRWEPQVGRRDAVRGSARFEAEGDGTKFTYELEASTPTNDRFVVDADEVVSAFVAWVVSQRPSLH